MKLFEKIYRYVRNPHWKEEFEGMRMRRYYTFHQSLEPLTEGKIPTASGFREDLAKTKYLHGYYNGRELNHHDLSGSMLFGKPYHPKELTFKWTYGDGRACDQ